MYATMKINYMVPLYLACTAAGLIHVKCSAREDRELAFDINDFNTYDDIMSEMDAMAARCDPAISCVVDTIGSSYEGRPIKRLTISSGTGGSIYWLDAAIHSREWLGPATLLKIMDHFTRNYGNDTEVTQLIDSFDWHFWPVVNPDGYEYTWTNDRDWRKNRAVINGSTCVGVDINRNFDSNWSNDGTSADPCDENYGGVGPASDPETRLIQDELVRLGTAIKAMLSAHAGGQAWVHPYGHTESGVCARAPNHDALLGAAIAAADATAATYGTTWPRGTTCETMGPASGGIVDFAYDSAGITYASSPEFRGPGWQVDPSNIEPSFQEIYNGLNALVAEIGK